MRASRSDSCFLSSAILRRSCVFLFSMSGRSFATTCHDLSRRVHPWLRQRGPIAEYHINEF